MMKYHNKVNFTTTDQDNRRFNNQNCATLYKAAWWYKDCGPVNLNGLYKAGNDGIWWHGFSPATEPSLARTEIKVRPTDFTPKKGK